jgi:hypothetical protein
MTFIQRLLAALQELVASKKVMTLLAGLMVLWAAKHGIVLSPEQANGIIALFSSLLLAQGAQDLGKAKAQIQAENPPPTSPMTVAGGDVTIQSQRPAAPTLTDTPLRLS